MENKQERFQKAVKSPLLGFMILGTESNYPAILTGQFDIEIKTAFFLKEFNKAPENLEEVDSNEFINEMLIKTKNFIRSKIQQFIDNITKTELPKDDYYLKRKQKQLLTKTMADMNKVSSFGTITEIATKFNLSKKEVRRMKNDGTLEEFIAKNS